MGLVAGLGELLGYGLRLASGFISDRTRKYWAITIVGYVIDLFAVPALALANHWELAAALMIVERIGKALRNPPREVSARAFWLYPIAIASSCPQATSTILSSHFTSGKTRTAYSEMIPLLYAVAMGMDALAALVFGRLFDRYGFVVIMAAVGISLFFAPLVFAGSLVSAIIGMALSGHWNGGQEIHHACRHYR